MRLVKFFVQIHRRGFDSNRCSDAGVVSSEASIEVQWRD